VLPLHTGGLSVKNRLRDVHDFPQHSAAYQLGAVAKRIYWVDKDVYPTNGFPDLTAADQSVVAQGR
jgi:hypothetical protein